MDIYYLGPLFTERMCILNVGTLKELHISIQLFLWHTYAIKESKSLQKIKSYKCSKNAIWVFCARQFFTPTFSRGKTRTQKYLVFAGQSLGLSECSQIIKIWLSIHTCQNSLNANALELILLYSSLVQHFKVVCCVTDTCKDQPNDGTSHLVASTMNSMAAFTALSIMGIIWERCTSLQVNSSQHPVVLIDTK